MPGGKNGFTIRKMPKEYPENPGQKRFKEVAEICNIHKGMTRPELIDAMQNCVPKAFETIRKRDNGQEGETPDTPVVKEGESNG